MEAEDGFPLNGLLYTPKGGASVVVVLVHGKTDTFLGGPSRFAPPLLAAEGIAAFALNLRVNSLGYLRVDLPFDAFISGERLLNMAGAAWERLEDGHKDLRAAVNYLRRLGYERIVIAGHSSGGFYCGDYAGRYQDFSALVLLSPLTTNRHALATWFRDEAEAEAARRRAEEMVTQGFGHHLLPLRKWYFAISAASLLDRMGERPGWWDDALRENQRPTLLLYGALEPRATLWQEKFETVIVAPRKEIAAIAGSEHMYQGHEHEVVDAILDFMRRHGL